MNGFSIIYYLELKADMACC